MECKVSLLISSIDCAFHWNITRMECKEHRIDVTSKKSRLEYNQNGM